MFIICSQLLDSEHPILQIKLNIDSDNIFILKSLHMK